MGHSFHDARPRQHPNSPIRPILEQRCVRVKGGNSNARAWRKLKVVHGVRMTCRAERTMHMTPSFPLSGPFRPGFARLKGRVSLVVRIAQADDQSMRSICHYYLAAMRQQNDV